MANGTLDLTPTGLMDGRGGNGGTSSHFGGSGGGGSGGGLRLMGKTATNLNGVIDLRGGRGGPKGYGYGYDYHVIYNVNTERPPRYGGDGAAGRLLVYAPQYANPDEVRVYGQMMIRQIATIPTSGLTAVAPPYGLGGQVTTTSYNFNGTTDVRWNAFNVASGATVDLYSTSAVRIYVENDVSISGTLRLNGYSPTSQTYAQYYDYWLNDASYYGPPSQPGAAGNMGGGKGGDANMTSGTASRSNAYLREATDGVGPAPGRHVMQTSSTTPTGYPIYTYYNWYAYTGDSGGTGAANATDGENSWACYAMPGYYAYLGAVTDTTGAGNMLPNGSSTIVPPRRLGLATTDPSMIAVSNISSFVGSGGGGGNSGGDTYYNWFTLGGMAGGGAGAVAIISASGRTLTMNGVIEAKGGDGTPPGFATTWSNYPLAHAGGGGGSGGTIMLVGDTVAIGAANPTTGTGGATVDVRGGMGGGWRSKNTGLSLTGYPEYNSTGSFGGRGGYGRLVVDYRSSLNSGRPLANRWGMEQTSYDADNTTRTLAGTARFTCPGFSVAGRTFQSRWYDLGSVRPIVTSLSRVVLNANLTLQVEGAQSHPHNRGTGTGEADPANTSGAFVPGAGAFLDGWRFFRFRGDIIRTSSSTGGPASVDDVRITYETDN